MARSLPLFALLLLLAAPMAGQGWSQAPAPLPGTLVAEVLNLGGQVTALVTVEDADGERVTDLDGPVAVRRDGFEDTLHFRAGYAKLPLTDARVGSLRLDYEGPAGPAVCQVGFRTVGAHTRSGNVAPWTAILPPLIAIALALLFREVVVSLLLGVLGGAWLLLGAQFRHLPAAIGDAFEFFILGALANEDHAAIILFSMLIGGMVAVVSRNGGMYGIVGVLSRFANSARNAQAVTWLLGIAVFFDDYANTLVVGNTMRPVTDRFRVSREKLAYIVDATAAPVAAVAFITTWIGAELDYIAGAVAHLGLDESAYAIFIRSLAYSFYPILTLVFIGLVVFWKRDFSTMRLAELRARETGEVFAPSAEGGTASNDLAHLEPDPGIRHRWTNAFLPVLTVVVVTMAGLWITGLQSLRADGHEMLPYWDNGPLGEKLRLLFGSNLLSAVIGAANSYTALIWASASGLLVAAVLSMGTGTLSLRATVDAAADGFKTMLPAILVLVLAWSLAAITEQLHTAGFLTSVFSDRLDPVWMPAITFVFSAIIAFSTGSSWSTMAILYPLLLPLTWNLGLTAGWEEAALLPIFHNVTASVLAGSVLGDHCSPISDTTVLSSLATNCSHIEHVRTQLPYALTVGGVSLLCGGLLVAFGVPNLVAFGIGLLLLVAILRYVGKPVPDYRPPAEG